LTPISVGEYLYCCLQLMNAVYDLFPDVTHFVRPSWRKRVLAFEQVEGITLKNNYVDVRRALRAFNRSVSADISES
jgi:hypothetical protein